MNCEQCNHAMEEGALFCKECGFSSALKEQKDKIKQFKSKARDVVLNSCHSKQFLFFTIIFTVMLVCYLVAAFLGGLVSIVSSITPIIFVIIATFELWKCYSADKDSLDSSLKRVAILDNFLEVIFIVCSTVPILLFVCNLFLCVVSLVDVNAETKYTSIPIIVYLLRMLASMISGSLLLWLTSVFKRIKKYFQALKIYFSSGEYIVSRAPIVRSIIFGIIIIFLGFLLFLSKFMWGFFTAKLINLLDEIGFRNNSIESISIMLEAWGMGTIVAGFGNFALGIFYICSGVWMFSVHKEIKAAELEIEQENKFYENIKNDIKQQMMMQVMVEQRQTNNEKNESLPTQKVITRISDGLEIQESQIEKDEEAERQRKQAEEEELARKREEEAAAQRKAQEQQQLMMQMMMQQMMANSGATPPVAPTPEQATSNDAKILELQREKEAAEEKARKAEEQQQLMMQMMQQMMEKMNSSQPAPAEKDDSAK